MTHWQGYVTLLSSSQLHDILPTNTQLGSGRENRTHLVGLMTPRWDHSSLARTVLH